MSKTETILEFCGTGSAVRVDRQGGLIRGVKILGRESRNGRSYTAAALNGALGLYEGAKVNVNHPSVKELSQPRSYQDRIGSLRGVRVAADGLHADLQVNPKHPIAEQLFWDAEHAPENVGLSHNVEGRTTRGRDGKTIVEEITKVVSVDLVADPATTKGLFEAVDAESERDALIEAIAAKVGYPAWAPPAAELLGLQDCTTPEEIEAYLAKRIDYVNKLLQEEKASSRRKLAAWDRIPAGCNPDDAAEFAAAIGGQATVAGLSEFTARVTGGLTHIEGQQLDEALGIHRANGRARKFANDIT